MSPWPSSNRRPPLLNLPSLAGLMPTLIAAFTVTQMRAYQTSFAPNEPKNLGLARLTARLSIKPSKNLRKETDSHTNDGDNRAKYSARDTAESRLSMLSKLWSLVTYPIGDRADVHEPSLNSCMTGPVESRRAMDIPADGLAIREQGTKKKHVEERRHDGG